MTDTLPKTIYSRATTGQVIGFIRACSVMAFANRLASNVAAAPIVANPGIAGLSLVAPYIAELL